MNTPYQTHTVKIKKPLKFNKVYAILINIIKARIN